MDIDVGEDDQMMRAIAISLGENVLVSTDQVTSPYVTHHRVSF